MTYTEAVGMSELDLMRLMSAHPRYHQPKTFATQAEYEAYRARQEDD